MERISIINMNVITRFPPSPTGKLHIGSARTALFNYLFARRYGGKIFLRLEDTDEERSRPEFETDILESLKWLGLAFDPIGPPRAPFWRQSERKEIYRAHLKSLVESDKAYVSNEAPTLSQSSSSLRAGREARRAEVIRFRNPNKSVAFDDLLRGRIEFDTTELGHFIIAKSLDEPLYHLAAVIDDSEMGVTHVIRGEDHISNTSRQILLQEALGCARPFYAHIPLILAPDRSKLSKRHGAAAVSEYRARGFLPEALVNYLALLGWNPGTEQEMFALDELIAVFDLARVQRGGAVFSEEKLRFLNKSYIKAKFKPEDLRPHIPEELAAGRNALQLSALETMLLERISALGDIARAVRAGEFDYLLEDVTLEPANVPWKGQSREDARAHLTQALDLLEKVSEERFDAEGVRIALMPYAEREGKGFVLWPVRFALSGREQSPDPFTLAAVLGKEETLKRLKKAARML